LNVQNVRRFSTAARNAEHLATFTSANVDLKDLNRKT
jgi:hypothetical protein